MDPSAILPNARPEITREAATEFLVASGVLDGYGLLGRRGYYRDTMGTPGANDLGIYDDAIMLVTPNVFRTFNANTDPSRELPGIARLEPGVWWYTQGIHGLSHPIGPRRYPALVQASPVMITRAGDPKTYSGFFGINIHHGSFGSTSSEGCQTIYPAQWDEFFSLVCREMSALARRTIPYVLTERSS